MAVATPNITIATDAAVNSDSEFVARFFSPPCTPTGIAKMPGQSKFTGTYYKVDRTATADYGSTDYRRASGAAAQRGSTSLSDATITVEERAYEDGFDMDEYADLPAFGLANAEERVISPKLSQIMMTAEERAFDTAADAWSAGLTNTDPSAAWDYDGNNPLAQLDTAFNTVRTASGLKIDGAVFSKTYFDALKNNAHMIGRMRAGDLAGLTATQLSELLRDALFAMSPDLMNEVGSNFQIRIATATHNTAKEGQTASWDWVYDDAAIVFARPPVDASGRCDLRGLGASKTFEVKPLITERYEEDRSVTEVYRIRWFADAATIDANAGYKFSGMLASEL